MASDVLEVYCDFRTIEVRNTCLLREKNNRPKESKFMFWLTVYTRNSKQL